MSAVLDGKSGATVEDSLVEQVENIIGRKTARLTWSIGLALLAHAFIAGGAWVDMTNDVEHNGEKIHDNHDDIDDVALLQRETAKQLNEVATEQAKRTASVSQIGELKGELRQLNETMQGVREDVTALKVRLDASQP